MKRLFDGALAAAKESEALTGFARAIGELSVAPKPPAATPMTEAAPSAGAPYRNVPIACCPLVLAFVFLPARERVLISSKSRPASCRVKHRAGGMAPGGRRR